MKYFKNRRLRYPHNCVIINNTHRISIEEEYIVQRIGKHNDYVIRIENLDKINNDFSTDKRKRSPRTLKNFINSSLYIKYCDGIVMSEKLIFEVERILIQRFKYNESINLGSIYKLISHGIESKFLERLRLLKNLISHDGRPVKILMYGITEGLIQWEIKADLYRGKNNPAYQHGGKLSPFSKKFIKYENIDDTSEVISKLCKKARETANTNSNNALRLSYYTSRGYSDLEARLMLKERQTTFSKDKCIKKHGEYEGLRIWQARQNKWQDTLTSKSQEEIDDINHRKFSGGGYSKVSQELFNKINITGARYGTQHGEYRVKLKSGKHCSFDYFYNNKVIEFNGDIWHANPNKFSSSDNPLIRHFDKNITAQDIWDRDAEKN